MAAFLAGSNVQADSTQTLHLMNTGSYGTCTDAAIGQNDNDNSHACAGYTMPASMVSQSFLSQQSTYGSEQNPWGPLAMANRATPYTWTSSNEMSFVPSNDITTQPLASKYVSMTPTEQQQFSAFSMATRQDEQEGASLNLHARPHALSLSLSPQRRTIQSMPYYTSMQSDGGAVIPDLTYVVGGDKGGSFKGDKIPNLAHLRMPSIDIVPGTLHNCMNNMYTENAHTQAEVSSTAGGFFTGSKYVKAVQHLLDEVVSVEDAIKKPSPSSKNAKWNAYGDSFVAAATPSLAKGTEPLNGHNSPGDMSGLTKGMAEEGMAAREGMPWGLWVAKVVPFSDPAASVSTPDLTPQARQEIQMKKAKLIAMLEEVDRRYKLYRSQMQAIVSLFESVAGVGSAKCYTALALQTISRHFRCLRDVIAGQVRLASKGLGEDDHFSQHRVLQQLHMMQQHAWRPQRGLPERAVSVLRAWLFEHFLHPYPKDADKIMLAKQTRLTRNQVSNWFINARVRLWKPMVEEMYQEEAKDMEANQRSHETEEEGDEARGSGKPPGRDAQGGGSLSQIANPSFDRGIVDEVGETLVTQLQHYRSLASTTQNSSFEAMVGLDPIHDAKKARSSLESLTAMSAGVYTNLCDLKGDGDGGSKLSFAYGPYYTNAPAGGIGHNSSLGALQGSNAISLTLGLQHSSPLEAHHDQTHQPLSYIQHLNETAASHSHGHHDSMHVIPQQLGDSLLERGNSNSIDITTPQTYYSSIAHLSNNGYEILSQLQNPKEYVGHVHPDFAS